MKLFRIVNPLYLMASGLMCVCLLGAPAEGQVVRYTTTTTQTLPALDTDPDAPFQLGTVTQLDIIGNDVFNGATGLVDFSFDFRFAFDFDFQTREYVNFLAFFDSRVPGGEDLDRRIDSVDSPRFQLIRTNHGFLLYTRKNDGNVSDSFAFGFDPLSPHGGRVDLQPFNAGNDDVLIDLLSERPNVLGLTSSLGANVGTGFISNFANVTDAEISSRGIGPKDVVFGGPSRADLAAQPPAPQGTSLADLPFVPENEAFLYGWVIDPGPEPGDYNDDGVVDAADYTVWRDTSFLTQGRQEERYATWAANYGNVYTGITPVPEPSSLLVLAGIGLLSSLARAGYAVSS